MVNREDVVDALSTFVAAYLVQLPEADKLRPEELQEAVKHACQVAAPAGWLLWCMPVRMLR